MPLTPPSSRFFGVDLHALWPELCRPWQGMHRWPALAWLTPDVPVRVLHADGHEALWRGHRPIATPNTTPSTPSAPSKTAPATVGGRFEAFEAIELPDEMLLRRSLEMPHLPASQVAQAALLDIQSVSPFAPTDLVWGHHSYTMPSGHLRIDTVFASRKQVASYLETQKSRLTRTEAPEVWAFTPITPIAPIAPIVLGGWGEGRRTQHGSVRRHWGYALLLLAACMVGGIAITPTAQLRLRAIEAVHSYTDVHLRTTPLMGEREAFIRTNEKLEGLRSTLSEQADPLQLLHIITQTLPDDTSVQTLQIQGLKVSMNGLTTDAAALIQLLSSKEGFRDVRSPSAAVRSPGATADNFNIEFHLDPAVWSIAAAPKAAP